MASEMPSQEQINKWKELELALRRNLEGNYVNSKIPLSVEHQIWLEGVKEGRTAQKGESSRASTQSDRSMTPEPESPVPQRTQTELVESPTMRAIKVYSDKKKKWFELIATFDTGTTDNWVTSDVVDLLEHTIVTVPYTQYRTFDGSVLDSSKRVQQVLWHGDGERARSRHTNFRVISEPAPFQVLFGSAFLFSECVMSFNEHALILATVKETKGDRENKESSRRKAEEEERHIAKQRQMTDASQKGLSGHPREKKEQKESRHSRRK